MVDSVYHFKYCFDLCIEARHTPPGYASLLLLLLEKIAFC